MSKTKASLLLAAVFAARGTSFLFSKTLMNTISPMSILAVRFLMAFLILTAVFWRKMRECDRNSLRGGVILGVLYTICMTFEMFGLRLVDTGTSSLIENMAIVLVPIFAAVLERTMPHRKTMICAVLAVAGVGFLSRAQSAAKSGSLGIWLTIFAAVTYAVCIMATEALSRDADPVTIGIIQLGVMGLLSLIAALCTEKFSFPSGTRQWTMMLLLVLLCSCFGFAFQPVGQKYVKAETAAVLTVINPLTASILGIAVAGESMSASKMAGYVLILFALVLYNLEPGRLRREQK